MVHKTVFSAMGEAHEVFVAATARLWALAGVLGSGVAAVAAGAAAVVAGKRRKTTSNGTVPFD